MPKHRGPSDDPFYAAELPGLDGLNAATANCKHEAGIYEHIEQAQLGPCAKLLYILNKGSDAQRSAAFDHLHVSHHELSTHELSLVMTELQETMWQLETSVQVSAATALLASIPSFGRDVLLAVTDLCESMLELKEERASALWSAVYLEVARHLPLEDVEKKMVDTITTKGQLSEHLSNRLLACALIGALCERLETEDPTHTHALHTVVTTVFLELILSLCQDTDLDVRSAIASFISPVSRYIGPRLAQETLMKELFEHLCDEESYVAKSAFCAVLDLLDFLEPAYRISHIYPVIKGYVRNTPESIRTCLIERYGQCVWGLRRDIKEMGDEDVLLFVRYFVALAEKGHDEERRWCAYNFPAVADAFTPLFATHLLPVARSIADDSLWYTRQTLAAGLHELCRINGTSAAAFFKTIVANFIEDTDQRVVDTLMQNVGLIFDMFLTGMGQEEKEKYFGAVQAPLVATWQVASRSLARTEVLVSHLHRWPKYFTSQQLHTTWIPLLFKQISHGPRALVDSCAETAVRFCRELHNCSYESETFTKFVSEFAKSKTYWNRLAFIQICKHTLEYYSRKFFRERMLEPVLELAKDSVSAVRRRLCALLPALKRALRPPAEVEHLATLIQVVARLQADTNPEVLEAIQIASLEIDSIEKGIRTADHDKDIRDSEKESEEGRLREAAMELDKLERRQKIREMLSNDKQEKTAEAKKGPAKRHSSERLPPAPTGSAVKQPLGGVTGSGPGRGLSSSSPSSKSKRYALQQPICIRGGVMIHDTPKGLKVRVWR